MFFVQRSVVAGVTGPSTAATPQTGIIAFSASWCPLLRNSVEHDSVDFVVIDIDERPDLAEQWRIRVIPTLVLVEQGQEMARHTGAFSMKHLPFS